MNSLIGKRESKLDLSHHQLIASSTRNELHLTKVLAKEVPCEPANNPDNCKGCGDYSQTGGKALLLNITETHFTEHGKVKLLPTYNYCLWYWKILCMLPKEEGTHQPSFKPINLQ